jgi:hypothetical protein
MFAIVFFALWIHYINIGYIDHGLINLLIIANFLFFALDKYLIDRIFKRNRSD